ncbi:MAG: hypothetical protein R2744_03200 [Bacteroidales bacterium]
MREESPDDQKEMIPLEDEPGLFYREMQEAGDVRITVLIYHNQGPVRQEEY